MSAFKAVSRLPEFDNEIKKLARKFRSIENDLEIFIEKQLNLFHKLKVDNRGIFQIADLAISYPKVYKAKKFACMSLKGKGAQSGIRVIYAYFEGEDRIELVEIYYKGEKEKENRQRIIEYYKLC